MDDAHAAAAVQNYPGSQDRAVPSAARTLGLLTLDDWAARMFGQIDAQLTGRYRIYPAVDVIIERDPATVRTPDLVVVRAAADETGPIAPPR